MRVIKDETGSGSWKFLVGKVKVASTTKELKPKMLKYGSVLSRKKDTFYTLTWSIRGLLKIGRKRGMKSVLTSSEYFSYSACGFFINYSQLKKPVSSVYVRKILLSNIRDCKKQSLLF